VQKLQAKLGAHGASSPVIAPRMNPAPIAALVPRGPSLLAVWGWAGLLLLAVSIDACFVHAMNIFRALGAALPKW
jgi:hypothetical protein